MPVRPTSGYQPMPAAAENTTDASAKVYKDMKLLDLAAFELPTAPDLGTSVLARLLLGDSGGSTSPKVGRGKKHSGKKQRAVRGGPPVSDIGEESEGTVLPKHGNNVYRLSIAETPSSVRLMKEREKESNANDYGDSTHTERKNAAIASSHSHKRKSVIVPALNL